MAGRTREQLPSAVHYEIKEAVRREAEKFNCSRSWITAERVANSFGIKLTFSYRSKR